MAFPVRRAFTITTLKTVFEQHRETHHYFKGEMHDFWEVVYVVSGKIGVTEDERVYELSAADMIFHRPMEFHKVWSQGTKKPHVLTMSFKTEGMLPSAIGEGVIHLNPLEENKYREIFAKALRLNESPDLLDPFAEQQFGSAFENFLLELSAKTTTDTKLLLSPDALRYQEIIKVMQNHLSENLSVSDIARLANMAPSTMKNAFSKYSDYGVHKHFLKLKIAAALPLLQKGMPIADISEQFAFSSQNYFSMVFKAEMGLPPLEYKKKYLI